MRFALRTAPMIIVNQDEALRTTWGYVLGQELDGTRGPAGAGPGFLELFVAGDAARFTDAARQVLSRGEGQRVELAVMIDGEPRTYDFRIEPTELGLNVVGFDITPSKLAEASLLDADQHVLWPR